MSIVSFFNHLSHKVRPADEDDFDVDADARANYAELMGFNLPIEERRAAARTRVASPGHKFERAG